MGIEYYKVEDWNGGLTATDQEHPLFKCAFRSQEQALDAAEKWLGASHYWHWEKDEERANPGTTSIDRDRDSVWVGGTVQVRSWPKATRRIEIRVINGEQYRREVWERADPTDWEDTPEKWNGVMLWITRYQLPWWGEDLGVFEAAGGVSP
jgi:hypothetical protein